MAMKEDFKNDLRKSMSFFEQKIREDLKKGDIRELSSCYIDLDEITKEIDTHMNKIKKYLSKMNFKEEFPEKGKYIQNVDGRAKSYISKEKVLEDFSLNVFIELATISDKNLREFLIKEKPELKDSEKELNSLIDEYKITEGKGNPSVRISKLKS